MGHAAMTLSVTHTEATARPGQALLPLWVGAGVYARPHVLAFPILVAWIAGLVDAADRRDAPPLALVLLIALWANLHGGFVFGLFFIAPTALAALVDAEPAARLGLALRWALFAALA